MMTDPIADMLTRVRNSQAAEKVVARMPGSHLKSAIAQVLKDEGYIEDFNEATKDGKVTLEIKLKYHNGAPVIERLQRVSKPGQRKYVGKDKLPRVAGGMGVAIVSTSQGIMTERTARARNLGGELLCIVV